MNPQIPSSPARIADLGWRRASAAISIAKKYTGTVENRITLIADRIPLDASMSDERDQLHEQVLNYFGRSVREESMMNVSVSASRVLSVFAVFTMSGPRHRV